MSILGNTPHLERIWLFDVLCGEGKYKDGAEGSALRGLRTVLAYFTSTPRTKVKLNVRLNDWGQSDVDPKQKKIQRVEEYASTIPLPQDKVTVRYSCSEYDTMLEEVCTTLKSIKSTEKSLVFIDPWGYKSIKPQKLMDLFSCNRCEILLFLPTTHMYRFANAATIDIAEEKVPACFLPLKSLLQELFDNAVPRFQRFEEFESELLQRLQEKIGAGYKSSFMLETASRNKYSLFFFTPHVKGLDAFNQACWNLDKEAGKGHIHRKNPGQLTLSFNGSEVEHINQLRSFIKLGQATNRQIYEFGVVNRRLTKSTHAALNHLRERGEVTVEAQDGKPVPKNANYLDYKPKREVLFKYTG
ncbi:three-Cys-motif partner protein TcmP [Hymenobacter sp. 5516J-16]|nr:three-Cys-motif partner protein TcmP [Hymenobacter sp. 5516J-16]